MVYLDDDRCEGSYFKFQKEIIKKVRIGNQKYEELIPGDEKKF